MMHDELIKPLRGVRRYTAGALTDMLAEAADAIEELSKSIDDANEANIALYGALPKEIVHDDKENSDA